MQHIEEAGIHSGDSACVIPPHSLPADVVDEIKRQTRRWRRSPERQGADERAVRRAPRRPMARPPGYLRPGGQPARQPNGAVRVQGDRRAAGPAAPPWSWSARRSTSWAFKGEVVPTHFSVKESVFPFNKFPGVDIILGPEMRSTGEVMGIDDDFPDGVRQEPDGRELAVADEGTIFISVDDRDKPEIVPIARQFAEMGYMLLSTRGTAKALRSANVPRHGNPQDPGGPAQPDRPHEERRDRLDSQHAERPRPAHRRGPNPRRGGGASRDVHHDALGRRGRRSSLPGAAAKRTVRRVVAGAVWQVAVNREFISHQPIAWSQTVSPRIATSVAPLRPAAP